METEAPGQQTLESVTSNDVGDQTLTKADTAEADEAADESADEATDDEAAGADPEEV